MLRALICGTMVLLLNAPFVCAEKTAQAYTGYYTGKIMPTPKEVEYLDEAWELADLGAEKTAACIMVSATAPTAVKQAAQDIQARISHLSGGIELPIVAGGHGPKGTKVFIAVGVPESDRFIAHHMDLCKTPPPDQPEGYVITPYTHKHSFQGVFLVGRDAAGAYFSAQSLVQMIERTGDKVVLHPAKVKDWPTFSLRSFKVGGSFGPDSDSMQMGMWAPFAKFNCYNICYTTLGRDKWVDPEPGYREHVKTLTEYMTSRGLDCMPFVNPYYLWDEHIETSDPGDLDKLFEACRIAPEAGARRVMLCLDDFASKPNTAGPRLYTVRSEKDKQAFGDDLAAVNIAMTNDLNRRLKHAYPHTRLYVVLPYYWNPSGGYRADGEDYLRKIGVGLDEDVRIVWTGPSVRSGAIAQQEIDYYQGLLGGRKVMLWDNTIYMHHSPPHYFLDTFHTIYPAQFWDAVSSEVHLNANSGEAYKCGLLATASYLWNPEAYDPETALRDAIAAVAGPDVVDDLLAFRDAFYTVYDEYAVQLGKPDKFLEQAKKMEKSPFDEAGIGEIQGLLDTEKNLADKLAATCRNEGLVAELRERAEGHAGYREALEILSKLPPMSEADAANIVPNPDTELVEGNRPAQRGSYSGAGDCTLSLASGHSGEHAAKLSATKLHDWPDGHKSINVALMIGDTNGYTGHGAAPVLPLHRYYFSFWMRGNAPRVVVGFTSWGADGERESRGAARVALEPFAADGEWTFYTGSFITPANAERGALKIGIDGSEKEGAGLGDICVDDVYVGRSKRLAEEGVDTK